MYFFHGVLILFLLAVIYYDSTRYIIPNWISGVLLALWPAMILVNSSLLPEDFSIWWSLGVMGAMFGVGLLAFIFNVMGGGDVKLLTVLALWAGREAGLDFLMITAMFGGVLAFGLLLVRPVVAKVFSRAKAESIPRVFRYGEPLPYGLAITAGFLVVLYLGDIPGLPVTYR